jgi:hypothetical protein
MESVQTSNDTLSDVTNGLLFTYMLKSTLTALSRGAYGPESGRSTVQEEKVVQWILL